MRPELERLPWGTLDPSALSDELLERARDHWMRVCLNEYQSAGALADTLSTMILAQCPLDLTSVVSRFVVEELSHAELAERLVAELGGGPMLAFPIAPTLEPPDPRLRPLVRVAYYIMRGFCTGEAFSLAMMRQTAKLDPHPLIAGILQRIAKDEAAHGAFGWIFFDWAADQFTADELDYIRALAAEGVREVEQIIADCSDEEDETFGWLSQRRFRETAEHALAHDICPPLRARGLLPA